MNCILCKDKISETKINLSNPTFGVNFEKCNEIVIDKINEMEAMKDMLSKYEDFVKYLQRRRRSAVRNNISFRILYRRTPVAESARCSTSRNG